MSVDFSNINAFQWDIGNSKKPKKHGLSIEEVDEAFFDDQRIVFDDWKHSITEKRFTLLGKTKQERIVNVTFTIRNRKIRVITARDINKKEVFLYEKAIEHTKV